MSQLLHMKLEGGHSQEAWAERLGMKKAGTAITDFSKLTPELLERCRSDVQINARIYEVLNQKLSRPEFERALDVEHRLAYVCLGMHLDGFKFDLDHATNLHSELDNRITTLDQKCRDEFRPRVVPLKLVTPRRTKHGGLNRSDFRWYRGSDYTIFGGGEFQLFEYQYFDPGSPKQVVERLNEAGWKPINKTDGHIEAEKTHSEKLDHFKVYGWKIDETNLATLPDTTPEAAKVLVERLMLRSRRSTLESWIALYNKDTKSIHGNFNGLGTWTHRMSHNNPNLANIATEKSIKYKTENLYNLAVHYGGEMRKLWTAPEGLWLVGCDADQIQLRVLAHYLNDEKFIQALLDGKKEDGTDLHTLNQLALAPHCKTRDQAKTFIYAFLLGAGVAKVAQILNCSSRDARDAVQRFISYYPGLRQLKENRIPQDAKRGYFQGFDGRLIICDSEHHMLAGYLQAGEAIVTKHACLMWRQKARQEGIKFTQVNFVHDEYQTYCLGSKEDANRLGEIQAESIFLAGESLKLNCPMKGNYRIGKNWHDTH